MQALIPLHQDTIGSDTMQTVNARDLHAFLGIARDYPTWIKTWLKKAHLVENRDFIIYHAGVENPHVGRPSIEYHLTFDAAKCVGMMSGSAKGDEVRQYFLDCEKAALAKPALPEFHNPSTKALIDTLLRVDALERSVAHADTKADLALASQQWLTIREFVFLNNLTHQMPTSFHADYGRWLTGYCLEHGIPVRKQGVADRSWEQEHAYHAETLSQTLPGWLMRRQGQTDLRIVPNRS